MNHSKVLMVWFILKKSVHLHNYWSILMLVIYKSVQEIRYQMRIKHAWSFSGEGV